jgi:hypothetical protein
VGDEDGRDVGVPQHAGELAGGGGPGPRVQRRQRLVEQQDVGAAGERPGQRDALALAAGERGRAGVGEVLEAEPREPVARLPWRVARGRSRSA